LAMKRRQASANPCQKELHENGLLLKGDNRRNRLLSDDEESRLMNALTGDREYLEPIVALALGAAMRRGNILSLTWIAVDFERACIYVTRTKADRNYSVPMNREVIEILRCLRTKSKSDYLFPNPKTGRPLNDVKRAFESACREAGIEDLWFHDLRRTAATR